MRTLCKLIPWEAPLPPCGGPRARGRSGPLLLMRSPCSERAGAAGAPERSCFPTVEAARVLAFPSDARHRAFPVRVSPCSGPLRSALCDSSVRPHPPRTRALPHPIGPEAATPCASSVRGWPVVSGPGTSVGGAGSVVWLALVAALTLIPASGAFAAVNRSGRRHTTARRAHRSVRHKARCARQTRRRHSRRTGHPSKRHSRRRHVTYSSCSGSGPPASGRPPQAPPQSRAGALAPGRLARGRRRRSQRSHDTLLRRRSLPGDRGSCRPKQTSKP